MFIAFVILTSISCVEIANPYSKLPPGIWRATLQLDNQNFMPEEGDEEVITTVSDLNDSSLPFNFEISYGKDGNMIATFINGKERIKVENIDWGRNIKVAKDTLRFNFPEYDSFIKASYEDNAMEGKFIIKSKENYSIPFKAIYGQNYRFTPLKKEPTGDLSGKWECTFEKGTPDEYKAIAEFNQKGNELTGTFRTETGDYRFLEGTMQENKAYLSAFDGTHVFLFTMKLLENDELVGSFRSGRTYKSSWVAKRNNDFELQKPSELTYLNEGTKEIDFEFPNAEGNLVSINDPRFLDKIKIVTLMGTWCPNCKDEMIFLKEVSKKHSEVEIIPIAFERYRDKNKAYEMIDKYEKTLSLPFPILYGGLASKKVASDAFPQLNKIISFPTLLILDKNNYPVYIHTGFNGPATSKYDEFKREFEEELEKLI